MRLYFINHISEEVYVSRHKSVCNLIKGLYKIRKLNPLRNMCFIGKNCDIIKKHIF